MEINRKILFGPVPSRRFGRSLGIDLTPYKTCSFDCVFCQLGRTQRKTLLRKEYIPLDSVLEELQAWFRSGAEADYITLSGSGEPTLYTRFGEVLDFIHQNSSIPSVLLTNGSLLYLPKVREAAARADVVKVSMSAWDPESYMLVNRPHRHLSFDTLIEGQKAFRACYSGQLWTEVVLLDGLNASRSEVRRIAKVLNTIGPDRIQLNTAVRPPAESFARAVSFECLEGMTGLFQPVAEIIAEFKVNTGSRQHANLESILSTLMRRPCTSIQLGEIFGMHINEISKYLGKLACGCKLRARRINGEVYYDAIGIKGDREEEMSNHK